MDDLPDLPPTPPALVQHKSAPSSSQTEGMKVPPLSRAFTAPTFSSSRRIGQRRFTDKTFDILLLPSQIERSPSEPQAAPGGPPAARTVSSLSVSVAELDIKKDVSKVISDDEQIKRIMSNFGVATLSELKLSMSDSKDKAAMIHLSVDQYTALHKSTGLPLIVGDMVDVKDLSEVDIDEIGYLKKEDGSIVDLEATVIQVRECDNAIHVEIQIMHVGDDKDLQVVSRYDTDRVSDRAWLFKLTSLVPRVAEEVWLRSDVSPIEMTPSVEGEKCCICLDYHPSLLKNICERPGELGGQESGCDVTCCLECFQAHVSNGVSSAKFSVAPIRCPGATCGRRLSMERWAWAVSSQPEEEEGQEGSPHLLSPLQSYLHNPKAISSIRCPCCDQVGVLFPKPALGEEARRATAAILQPWFKEGGKVSELEDLWLKYAKGEVSASSVVECLVRLVPPDTGVSVDIFLEENQTEVPEQLDQLMKDAILPLVPSLCYIPSPPVPLM